MKEYEVTLWPNNQPPILVGYYKGNKANVKREICNKYSIDENDDALTIAENKGETPYKRWQKH